MAAPRTPGGSVLKGEAWFAFMQSRWCRAGGREVRPPGHAARAWTGLLGRAGRGPPPRKSARLPVGRGALSQRRGPDHLSVAGGGGRCRHLGPRRRRHGWALCSLPGPRAREDLGARGSGGIRKETAAPLPRPRQDVFWEPERPFREELSRNG